MRQICIATLASLLIASTLAACADTADSFPLNDAAKRIGDPKIDFIRTGLGRGPVTITMPSGEVLKGEWRVASSGAVAMAFSGGHSATALAVGDGNVQFVARGTQTEMLCRGDSSPFGHGTGECQTYEGALWTVSW